MATILKKQKDNTTFRPNWYGLFRQDGKAIVFNTGIPWKGTPPETLRLKGDAAFEVSRAKAESAVEAYESESRQKGKSAHLVERLLEFKTGRAVKYAKLADLPTLWRELDRDGGAPTERYLKWCDSVFRRFVESTPCEFLYQVTAEQAKSFIDEIRRTRTAKTTDEMKMLLRSAFNALLPVGTVNPFGIKKKGRKGAAKNKGGEMVGRQPLTPEELETLFKTAKTNDPLLYRLAVVAAFTSLRIGDVCLLKWADVDLNGEGWIKVITAKTGAEIEVPFLDARLREVLEMALAERADGERYVFPEAAKMYDGETAAGNQTRNMIYYRGKALFARAFADATDNAVDVSEDGTATSGRADLADVLGAVLKAVKRAPFTDAKQARILDSLSRVAGGKSYRDIEAETGRNRAIISQDLHDAETVSGFSFRRGASVKTGQDLKTLIQATRQARKIGAVSASIYGWHNLRGTFCCLAFAAGYDIEFVSKATGHTLAETMRDHYFNPRREHWRQAMKRAGALIEKIPAKRIEAAPKQITAGAGNDLSTLAGKIAAGTATAGDKAKFKKLAAKV